MSVDLQILNGLFLNKEREKWWKTIGTTQRHSSKNLEKEHDMTAETYTTICCCLMGK
jgi:hypothetical protein